MTLRTVSTISALIIATSAISAQAPKAAPMPSQFATAKTIFVAYAGAPLYISPLPAGQLLYTDLQSALAANGRYTVATKPADAELSMQLSIGPVIPQGLSVRLAVFDTKTGMLLWTIDEPMDITTTKGTATKLLNEVSLKLVDDLSNLAAAKFPEDGSAAPTKTRFSDEPKK